MDGGENIPGVSLIAQHVNQHLTQSTVGADGKIISSAGIKS